MSMPASDLPYDLVEEILLRLPPEEPQWLVRASVVCKPWRLLLSDPAFLRRHREHHRRLPVLGFLRTTMYEYGFGSVGHLSQFFPATAFRPSELDHRPWQLLDCRHGRALLYDRRSMNLLLWDPMTGEKQQLRAAGLPQISFAGAVLCATAGCDHLDCHGGPFRVAFVGTDFYLAHACLYSSETAAWSASTSQEHNNRLKMERSVLVGDRLYFFHGSSLVILRYELGGDRGLSTLACPCNYVNGIALFPVEEDGVLWFAGLDKYELSLWALDTDADGVECWVPCRVIIDLEIFLIGEPSFARYRIAFVDCHIVLVRTDSGVLMIELELGRVTKVLENEYGAPIFPYMGFFNPVRSRGGAAARDHGAAAAAAAPVCLIPAASGLP